MVLSGFLQYRVLRGTRLLAVLLLFVIGVGLPRVGRTQSENLELLGRLHQHAYYSDVWGYTSPEGVELAIVGLADGTWFVNATDPKNPVTVAVIPGPRSNWRDIKTWDQHAYIVNEGEEGEGVGGNGLQIVSLRDPLAPIALGESTTWFRRAHNIFIDSQTGFAYCVGTDAHQGALVLDLSNPIAPTFVTSINDYYIHDLYVRDGIAYAAAINDGFMFTIDVSNLPSYSILSTSAQTGATHNTWLTEDGRYCLTSDETDGGHLKIFDVQNPSFPIFKASWQNPDEPLSSIHNVLVHRRFAYVAWYTSGLQIIDMRVPSSPQRVAYYDTYPGRVGFRGAWGVYPFQPSGNIYVSDIQTGLYVFEFTARTGTLEGVVTDLNTGQPVEGVVVEAEAAEARTTTDSNGFYTLELAPGIHRIDFARFRYSQKAQDFEIVLYESTDGATVLEPKPVGVLSGLVRNRGTGARLGGATVQILSTPLMTTSDTDGGYAFSSVPVGRYTVRVALYGLGLVNREVDVVQGSAASKVFYLDPSSYLDDIETLVDPSRVTGWTLGAPEDDADPAGHWVQVDPVGTSQGGVPVQPEDDHTPDGTLCFVTGNGEPGTNISLADVDRGKTTLLSPVFDLARLEDPWVRYHRWYSNDQGPFVDDELEVDVSTDGGASWTTLERLGETRNFWEAVEFRLLDFVTPTNQVRFRFVAQDGGAGSIVEAGVDDFEIYEKDRGVDRWSAGLLAPLPNPVPGSRGSVLRFEVERRQPVSLLVYDVRGRLVREVFRGMAEAGRHFWHWDARDHSGRRVRSGIYLQVLATPDRRSTGKLVVVQ